MVLEDYAIVYQLYTEIKNDDNVSFRSEPLTVEKGVPQGTILGPLLFLLYVNDFIKTIPNAYLFGDDTSVVVKGLNTFQIQYTAETTLHKITNWFHQNDLKLNIEKNQIAKLSVYTNNH